MKNPIAIAILFGLILGGCATSRPDDLQYIGRTTGEELGRAAGNGYDSASRIGSLIMGTIGSGVGSTGDKASAEFARDQETIKQAKRQAEINDAYTRAYDAERLRRDKNYVPNPNDPARYQR